MNTLHSRLGALRRRLRLVVTLRGVCLAAATLLTGLLLAGVVDAVVYRILGVETWSLLRAGFLTATLSGAGAVSYLLLFRPLAARTDDLSLALRVEEQYPILNDALASTVQFLEKEEGGRMKDEPRLIHPSSFRLPPFPGVGVRGPGTSPSLEKEAVQRALRLAQGCDFNKAVNSRGLSLSVTALIVVLAAALPLALLRPALAWTALARVADPFGDHSWVGKTELEVRCPAYLAIGQPLSIAGEVRGVVPPRALIEFDDLSMPPRQVEIKETTQDRGSFVANLGVPPVARPRLPTPGEIRFRVRAGNAVSPRQTGAWHSVALRLPPQLAALGGKPSPQIVIRQPLYTELSQFVTLPEGTGNLDVVAGSQVVLRAATDRPIQHAWIAFKPLLPGAKDALLLAGLGPRHPLDAVAATALANRVWGRVPAVMHPSGMEFTIHFMPALTGAYILTIQDHVGLGNSYEFDLNVKPDPVPLVSLLRPSASQSVLANAEVTLQIEAEDEIFALRTVFLQYRRKDKHGQWLESEPKRLLFYDHAKAQRGLPQVLCTFAGASLPTGAMLSPPFLVVTVPKPEEAAKAFHPTLHLRPQRLLITQRWSLRGLALEGETLVVQACAEDFNDLVAFPQAGRSHEIELKIVGKAALAAVLDEQEVQIQQQLLTLRAMQDRAIHAVIGAEQQWRATGKLRPEDLVELAEAEQVQKDIQARIGAKKDEGLRAELAQLEEMLKDNKLPKSEVTERIRAIREELDRLSRENLPKIEPGLTKARRELEAPAEPRPPDPKEAGDLGEARGQQEKVYQALDDLLKLIQEQSTFQQLKGELRAVLGEQQEREQEVAKLQDQVELHGAAILRQKNQLKGELRRSAELQRRLADRATKLIDQLKQVSEKLADDNPQVAEMLARAAKIGGPLPDGGEAVPEAMRDIANDLRDDFDFPLKSVKNWKGPYLPSARGTQIKVIEALEKMLQALDQTRADEVERLVVRQKKEEKNLNDMAARMGQLQDQIDKAAKIADPKQREAALKKLGDDLRDLRKQADDLARDLARAQAQEAANDLNVAVQKMERALRLLERGEEPEDALEQAQERIDAARGKLKEARDNAESELAREQIAKIVDRLKGFKERQDAIVIETERLRKDFLLNNKWMQGKVGSMADLQDVQKGLAGETGLLRDKLKGAKVFHVVLDRSHQDMTAAAAKLYDWRLKASGHQLQKSLEEKDLAVETLAFEAAVKPQKSASDRLQRLIDALLPELEVARQDPRQSGPKQGGGGDAGNKGGIRAQDGIPPVAQLKALKAEQLEVNARTKEFAEQHPNVGNLSLAERDELEAIHGEQERLLQLFRELIAPPAVEGDKQ